MTARYTHHAKLPQGRGNGLEPASARLYHVQTLGPCLELFRDSKDAERLCVWRGDDKGYVEIAHRYMNMDPDWVHTIPEAAYHVFPDQPEHTPYRGGSLGDLVLVVDYKAGAEAEDRTRIEGVANEISPVRRSQIKVNGTWFTWNPDTGRYTGPAGWIAVP